MKVNQIVGEHKKGFRAKKYTKKTQHAIEPVKPKKPVGPGEEDKLNEDDAQQTGYTVKSTNPSTGEITVTPNVAPSEIKPGSTINLDAPDQAMGEEHNDDDLDDNTTANQVRRMASWLENRWGSYEDWGLEELQSIADELNISLEEVVEALGLSSSEFDSKMAETDEIGSPADEIPPPPIGQPEDDQQMEAIKRLAGL